MEEKNRCYRCKHMDRYYVKETTCYRKTRFGRCRKHGENVGIHDGCGEYCPADYRRKSTRLLRFYLSDLLTEISEVRKVIEAEREGETDEDL